MPMASSASALPACFCMYGATVVLSAGSAPHPSTADRSATAGWPRCSATGRGPSSAVTSFWTIGTECPAGSYTQSVTTIAPIPSEADDALTQDYPYSDPVPPSPALPRPGDPVNAG